MTAPRFFLIDGSAYFYRAFYAVRGLSTSAGMPTNAVYGFTTMLTRILKAESPDAVAVVFDAPGRTFRDDVYAEYKANRDETPEDLGRVCLTLEGLADGASGEPLCMEDRS